MSLPRLRLPAEMLKDTRSFAKRSSPFFVVRAKANGLQHPRFAVIVSIKVDRRSSARHLLKRRIAERLRKGRGGRDLVITVLPAAKQLQRKIFLEELERML